MNGAGAGMNNNLNMNNLFSHLTPQQIIAPATNLRVPLAAGNAANTANTAGGGGIMDPLMLQSLLFSAGLAQNNNNTNQYPAGAQQQQQQQQPAPASNSS